MPAINRLVAAILALLLAQPAWAQNAACPDTPAGEHLAWVIGVLSGEPLGDAGERFEPAFLEQVSPDDLRDSMAYLHAARFGSEAAELERIEIEPSPEKLVAVLVAPANGTHHRVTVVVNPDSGLMSGLLIAPAPELDQGAPDTWDDIDEALAALPGRSALGAFELDIHNDPQVVHTFNADDRLAIGSAFKLYVLEAFLEGVEAGDWDWSTPIAIRDDLKSLPTGTMQLLDAGRTYPTQRYAENMVRISDNTATDHLLAFIGRERVERTMARLHDEPTLNRPFLSTIELFKLKLNTEPGFREAYIDADENTRRAMLAPGGAVAEAPMNTLAVAAWKHPVAIDTLEWFASPRELARVWGAIASHERGPSAEPLNAVVRANPGMPFPPAWKQIAFKGGSEPGVLCLSWLLTRSDGRRFVLAMTINRDDGEADQGQALRIAASAATILERHGR